VKDKRGNDILFVDFYREGPSEVEDWDGRFQRFGGPPAVTVAANLSGRHEGSPQVREFVDELLSRFRGVAEDDFALRFWTRDEVVEDAVVDGRPFGAWRPPK
jgi:hypothetical protein